MRKMSYIKYFLIILVSFISLVPFYILLLIALKDPSQSLSSGNLIIPQFELSNFIKAWVTSNMGRAIFNSLVITAGSLILLVLVASSAGYAISRFPNKFHKTVFYAFLLSMMIPAIINTVPLFILMRQIGGINTRWAMIFVCVTTSLPLSVFLYTNFMKTVPREIEEAAVIDGCSYFLAFWKVIFPIMKPVTAAVVIINGLSIWNNYAQAVFFLQRSTVRTIPLAISMFFQQYGAHWNLLAAASVIGMAPAVIVFLGFQRLFIKGIGAGSIKG